MRPLLAEDIEHVLTHAHPAFEQWGGKNLFVTGGTGFFGSWLVETWLAAERRWPRGGKLTVLSRDPEAFLARRPHLRTAENLFWIAGDIMRMAPDGLADLLGGAGAVDGVIHMVTEADVGQLAKSPLASYELIVESTRKALEVARLTRTSRFLFTSSGAVYGRQPTELTHVPETLCTAPDTTDLASAYGLGGNAKRQAETLCAVYGKTFAFETIIARCFTFYGPYLPLQGKFAIGNFLSDALAGRDFLIKGDGTPVRSYLYGADLAVWLWRLLACGRPQEVYNVGSEQPISVRELANVVRLCSGSSASVVIKGVPDPSRLPDRYVPSTRRAAEDIGLREEISLETGLARTWKWLQP